MLLFGCHTSEKGAFRRVDFFSEPERATVFINGRNSGLTPLSVQLERSKSFDVRFSRPGYFDGFCVVEPCLGEGNGNISTRVELVLERITQDALFKKRESVISGEEKSEIDSDKVAFLMESTPTNFADFLLKEKELFRLFKNGVISDAEFRTIRERLREIYHENPKDNAQ